MKNNLLLSLLLILSCSLFGQNTKVSGKKTFGNRAINSEDYLPNTIIFKVKNEFRSSCRSNSLVDPALNSIFTEIGAESVNKKFPGKIPPSVARNSRGETLVDLSLIYSLKYSSAEPLERVIQKLYNTGMFEYVEPQYIYKLSYNPNDPSATSTGQYYLTNIRAYTGWDISKGDTNTVVGIVDSGSDMNHPDLMANVKKNYADPVNGIDDDGDGYIDNFEGWDLGGADYNNIVEDNNPTITGSNNNHGSHVAGCASAVTDNGVGVAGVGFNTKLLIVKCASDNDTRAPGGVGYIVAGYEGITYAADHGAQIINCSWGGTGGGQFGQDIINYATFNQNSLVIAAAGNSNVQTDHFPSSYENVISVASTTSTDAKSSFSNYGYTIDVCAPGSSIYSTIYNNGYASLDGTFMASPIAAGAAAIIKSFYPNYTALQVGEQLKVTCDNINSVNGSYINKLGSGRINLYRALTVSTLPSVVITSKNITDNNDNAFVANDTLSITGLFTNYLAPTTNLTATLTSGSTYVSVLDGSTTLGVIPTLGTADNNIDPFKVLIKSTAPLNANIAFKLTLTDGTYTSIKMLVVTVNVDYINVQINDVATTITSKGLVGYNKDAQVEGLGFSYKGGASLLYEMGLMIGSSSTAVSDIVRGTGATGDKDFASVARVQKKEPSAVSEFDIEGKFNDAPSTTPQNLVIKHKAFAWGTPGFRKFVIVEYNIKNNGTSNLNNLYAGVFADWDILDYVKNKASFDSTTQMGYCFSTDSNLFAGIKLLTDHSKFTHYAIDNIAGGGGGVDISNGFDVSQKYTTLSTNKDTAGAGAGNDVIDVVSSGPFNLTPGDSVIVAFALLAGDSLEDIKTTAINAQIKYNGIVTSLPAIATTKKKMELSQIFPNPASHVANIDFTIPERSNVDLSMYNMVGQQIATITNKTLEAGKHSAKIDVSAFNSGVYFYKLTVNGESITKKMTVTK